MPIYIAELLRKLTIVQITGDDKVRTHLANLGLVPGEEVMVVNKVDENIIIKIKGVSLAISKELARRILV